MTKPQETKEERKTQETDHGKMPELYADVIVNITSSALDRTFSYIVPEELASSMKIGSVVEIPFGKGDRLIRGYVVGLRSAAGYDPEKMKAVSRIVMEDL